MKPRRQKGEKREPQYPRSRAKMPQKTNSVRCKATGKLSWKTEQDAITALAKTLLKRDRPKQERRVYKCEYGEHWHLTSMFSKESVLPPMPPTTKRDLSGFDRVLGRASSE